MNRRVNGEYVNKNRRIGEFWERKFCELAGRQFGKSFTAHQIGREKSAQIVTYGGGWNTYTAPDITVWTAPGEHHEIKHKDPAQRRGKPVFGLEEYRLNALVWFAQETGQAVMYTIHNYGFQPDQTRKQRKSNKVNKVKHWLTANILELSNNKFYQERGESICNGVSIDTNIIYWPINYFMRLDLFWESLEGQMKLKQLTLFETAFNNYQNGV